MIPSPQELKGIQRADVYRVDVLAGHLTRQDDGTVQFDYNRNYLIAGNSGIATSLPATSDFFVGPGGALPAYFSGLLPEGHRLTVLKNATKPACPTS